MQSEGLFQPSNMDINTYMIQQYLMNGYDPMVSLGTDQMNIMNPSLPDYKNINGNFIPIDKVVDGDANSCTGSTENSAQNLYMDDDIGSKVFNQYDSIGSYSTIAGINHDRLYGIIPEYNIIPSENINEQTPNSTIDGESIGDDDELIGPDGTAPPSNRRDPIYTAISGLKWKPKSKKWVVRWDNPITNRRVYKYFSGVRYGFMGAHKRAKYYLEFLNASVGRIAQPSTGNPFCRRTEGPPKGKTNKGLLRRVLNNKSNYNFYQMDHTIVMI